MSDFSLMDAIECGIVKLPRVPVADNIPGGEMPMFRNLWEHIGKDMPKKGRGKAAKARPAQAAPPLQTALRPSTATTRRPSSCGRRRHQGAAVLHRRLQEHGHVQAGLRLHLRLPARNEDGTTARERPPAAVPQSRRARQPLPRPRTLLIDSEQLESGDALDDNFRGMAPTRSSASAARSSSAAAMPARRRQHHRPGLAARGDEHRRQARAAGRSIRCVVSVSMLTEGWDANTVTHVLGIRAFGTQLLCEQVIGRALRRQSYELNEEGLFNVEYADVLRHPLRLHRQAGHRTAAAAARDGSGQGRAPERDALEIRFPRVEGYRVELPEERLTADFNDDSILELSPDLVGPPITRNSGIIGEAWT
jgi:type III restriction enzyme